MAISFVYLLHMLVKFCSTEFMFVLETFKLSIDLQNL